MVLIFRKWFYVFFIGLFIGWSHVYGEVSKRAVCLDKEVCQPYEDKQHNTVYYKTDRVGRFLNAFVDANPDIAEDVMVLLDLDDTTITLHKDAFFAASGAYFCMLKDVMKSHDVSAQEGSEMIFDIFQVMQNYAPFHLTDPMLAQVIGRLRAKRVQVYGFTARDYRLIPLTQKQLKETNVLFTPLQDGTVSPHTGVHPIYTIKEGVFFIGEHYPKGQAFHALWKKGSWEKKRPSKIVFLDDRKDHLESFMQVFNRHYKNIELIPVLSTFPHNHHRAVKKEEIKREIFQFLYHYRGQEDVQDLLCHDPFVHNLVLGQCSLKERYKKNIDQCKALKPMLECPIKDDEEKKTDLSSVESV